MKRTMPTPKKRKVSRRRAPEVLIVRRSRKDGFPVGLAIAINDPTAALIINKLILEVVEDLKLGIQVVDVTVKDGIV